MDGSRSVEQFADATSADFPEVGQVTTVAAVDQLIAGGFIEDVGQSSAELTAGHLEHCERSQRLFSWVTTQSRQSTYDAQLRATRSRVTILGLGGAGSTVASALVALGVGSVHCVDSMESRCPTCNRQLLYTECDVSFPKVSQAVNRLRHTGASLRIGSVDDLVPFMDNCDLLLLCADEPRGLIDQ